ncbi:hypothetical protein OAI_00940 [Vibrio cyclitrophicus FF160]|uniref:restriction endonuclease subunit S n=1 Tax=Vibrio cyclitrophicus TaxID=47951 RepID=UPI000315D7DD|nr:restriction endonuclease subunit S [Vibrio cyclitrophicus]OEE82854.1 hypothetical protein OAI_00940 [Vibrio cyclitrophicus FF160]
MTGRYKAYPEYKDSGVQWLNSIPSHWFSTQIKYGFDITLGKMLTKEPKNSSYQLRTYLKAVNIQTSGVDVSSVEKMWFSPSELTSLRLEKNDLLISEGGDVGRSAIWNEELPECYIQNAINRARPLKTNVSKFLFYWMHSLKHSDFIDIICNKATIAHYTAEKVEASPLFLPPQEEQQKIANFLDHETTKIDTLITKQEKLIRLLKEKRQAVISHAVTKGLNPDATMKDSGVEWLGEVPEHWGVPRIKQLVATPVTDGPHETPTFVDSGVPFVSAEAVSKGFVNFNKIRGFITKEQNAIYSMKYTPQIYDIYMVKSGATTGVTAIVETNDTFNIWSPLAVIRCKEDYSPYFVLNFMRSHEFLKAVELNWSFGTQQNIGMGVIENLHVACPPRKEASEIASYLQNKMAKYEKLVEKANKQILFMKERKTALISAAVTGKIDVRDWQPQTEVVSE